MFPQVLTSVVLDFPGLLFFTTYTLLVLFWAEIYYQVSVEMFWIYFARASMMHLFIYYFCLKELFCSMSSINKVYIWLVLLFAYVQYEHYRNDYYEHGTTELHY